MPEPTPREVKCTHLPTNQFKELVTNLQTALWDSIPAERREELVRNQGGAYVDPSDGSDVKEFSELTAVLFAGFLQSAFGIVQDIPTDPDSFFGAIYTGKPTEPAGYEFAASFLPGVVDARFITLNNIIRSATLVGAEPEVLEATHPIRTLLRNQDSKRRQHISG